MTQQAPVKKKNRREKSPVESLGGGANGNRRVRNRVRPP